MYETTTFNEQLIGAEAPSPSRTVRSEIVSISGKKWLLGMRWRSYESAPDRADIESDAEVMDADWIARRVGEEAIQVGYCSAFGSGWPRGIYSLAALLADSHKVPWAGAFDLGNGLYWYISVRDNYQMMPDGDVVGTLEDIQTVRTEHASLEDFNHVEGTLEQLEELIDRAKAKKTALESLTSSRVSPPMMIAVACALAVLVGGYFGYSHYQNVQEQKRQALMRQEIMKNALAAQQAAAPDLQRILRSKPDSDVWLAACRSAVYRQPLWVNGWQLKGFNCSADSLTTTWKRGPEATIAYTPPGAVASADGDSATVRTPLPFPADVHGSDDAASLREAETHLILWAQQHAIRINLSATAVSPPPKTNMSKGEAALGLQPPTPIPQATVSFSVPAAPFALSFAEVPGFRFTEVSLDDVTGADSSKLWKISGVVYGRPN
jgi:hypothetical protein